MGPISFIDKGNNYYTGVGFGYNLKRQYPKNLDNHGDHGWEFKKKGVQASKEKYAERAIAFFDKAVSAMSADGKIWTRICHGFAIRQ